MPSIEDVVLSPSGRRRVLAWAAFVAGCAWSFTVTAQPSRVAAQELFRAGRQLMKEHRYGEACPKFAESLRLYHAVSSLLNLARCHELVGKTATAWSEYSLTVAEAKRDGDEQRAQIAAKYLAKLKPRLTKLTIIAERPIPYMVITRDSIELGPAALGVAIAVDPGWHQLGATAPGYRSWSKRIFVKGDGARARAVVPALQPMPAANARAKPRSSTTTPQPSTTTRPVNAARPGWQPLHYGALVASSVGAAALLVGSALGIAAKSKWDEAQQTCGDDGYCTEQGAQQAEDARALANGSTAAFGIGAMTAAAGVLLWIASPGFTPDEAPAHNARAAVTLLPLAGPQIGGLMLRGTLP